MKRFSFLALVLFSALVLGLDTGAAKKPPRDNLQRFFQNVKTYSAAFNQVVLDEGLNVIQESSGRLWIQRPGKFQWAYNQPFKQYIIGDGEKVWVYDVELKQATVREMQGALGQTPAILLAGKGRLMQNFKVKRLGRQGKLEWMQMIPRNKDGGFEDIRLGFEGRRLRMLEMIDGFGQTTRVTLSDARENKKIDPKRFRFTPPEGVDVVGQ